MKLKRYIQTHKRNNLLPYLKNDFEVPIDNNWLIPERILYTTDMFSVILPDTVRFLIQISKMIKHSISLIVAFKV